MDKNQLVQNYLNNCPNSLQNGYRYWEKQWLWVVLYCTIILIGKSTGVIPDLRTIFLIVTPGITIKDRLSVLFVDTKNKNSKDIPIITIYEI